MTLRKTLLSGAIAGTLLVLGLCARGGERVASSWGASFEVASAFLVRSTTEDAEIYGRSRRSSPPEIKPSKPQNHAADYTRFSPLALGKWKSGKVEEWKSSATHFSTIQLFYYSTRAKRVGRAFGLKERSGTASVGLVLHFNAEFRGIGERGVSGSWPALQKVSASPTSDLRTPR